MKKIYIMDSTQKIKVHDSFNYLYTNKYLFCPVFILSGFDKLLFTILSTFGHNGKNKGHVSFNILRLLYYMLHSYKEKCYVKFCFGALLLMRCHIYALYIY